MPIVRRLPGDIMTTSYLKWIRTLWGLSGSVRVKFGCSVSGCTARVGRQRNKVTDSKLCKNSRVYSTALPKAFSKHSYVSSTPNICMHL